MNNNDSKQRVLGRIVAQSFSADEQAVMLAASGGKEPTIPKPDKIERTPIGGGTTSPSQDSGGTGPGLEDPK